MAVGKADIPTDKLCLVVGVTGHRDIAAADESALRASFGRILQELAAECPHLPLIVLSGLAAGSDALAAEEALARNVPVIACLPMPAADYEADFSPNELLRFRSLLARCARVRITSPDRENGYVATGLFIAHYSHVLIAFWDGTASRGAGGTANVLSLRLTGNIRSVGAVANIPYLPDVAPAYQIVTPRADSPRPDGAFEIRRMYPKRYRRDVTSETDFHAILGRMDLYNVDLAQTQAPVPSRGPLGDLMERTDAAANSLQRRTNIFQAILYGFAFIGGAFQIVAQLPSFVKLLALIAGFIAYQVARRNDYENRYQDYRALAEGLRVQEAWYCAGLTHDFADRSYLKMQEGELQWIRMALRSLYLLCCDGRECPDASADHPNSRAWIRSQWRYYYRASRGETALVRTLERCAIIAVAIGLAATLASAGLLLPKWLHQDWWSVPRGRPSAALSELLTVPFAISAMLAALVAHYIERRNLAANARRYERMFNVFDRARRELLAEPGDDRRSREILLAIGRAALIEHADWLIMRRDRPIRVVVI